MYEICIKDTRIDIQLGTNPSKLYSNEGKNNIIIIKKKPISAFQYVIFRIKELIIKRDQRWPGPLQR